MLWSLKAFASAVLLVQVLQMCLSMSSVFNPRRARVAVDYGPRIIGIARSNYLGVVEPYGTLRNKGNLTDLSLQVLQLAKTWSASEIVIGVPLDSDGKMHYRVRNLNGRLCLNFSTVLSTVALHTPNTPLTTLLFDERYTTKEAKLRLLEGKKASLDAMSAACILERYLEDAGDGAIEAQQSSYPVPADLAHFDYEVVRRYVRKTYHNDPKPNNDHMKMGLRKRRAPKEAGDGFPSTSTSTGATATVTATASKLSAVSVTGEAVGTNTDGDQNDLLEPEPERELTEAELQQLEAEQVRALRRKKGTLKRK
ncbi:hypothetical protein B484DRAFT_98930 [Ochromonadaceae sp. CCMP2298]|jgi:RNase H-fold protein (predicted Holliday junction resolvase)|nr:hypothetical protein B484DRAFT_98930 [Ochromonadaceae sp. CCMP2298]